MTYRLNKQNSPSANVRRIAREQLQKARQDLRPQRSQSLETAVHSARKRIKRVRSLVRLARPGLQADAYRRINHALRDIRHTLSATRDRHIVMQTRQSIDQRRRDGRTAGSRPTQPREGDLAASAKARRQMASLTRQVGSWPIDEVGRRDIERGAKRLETRCQRAHRAAKKHPTASSVHDWRKRVKDMQHVLELRGRSKSPKYRATKKLAQILGDYHDLDVLRASLKAGVGQSDRALRSKIDERQASLRAAAFDRSRRNGR